MSIVCSQSQGGEQFGLPNLRGEHSGLVFYCQVDKIQTINVVCLKAICFANSEYILYWHEIFIWLWWQSTYIFPSIHIIQHFCLNWGQNWSLWQTQEAILWSYLSLPFFLLLLMFHLQFLKSLIIISMLFKNLNDDFR